MKTLSKEPSARYRTADQLGRVLQNFGGPTAPLRPINPDTAPISNSQPVMVVEPAPVMPSESPDVDWPTVGLGLIALVAVLGLIPLSFFIYALYLR
jgi:hypothetical protein